MTIQVTGKNLDVGEALRGYVQERVGQTVEKFIGRETTGHVRIEKEHGEFRTNCTIHLWQGMSLEAHGVALDAYQSADLACERLEKRVEERDADNPVIIAETEAPVHEMSVSDAVMQMDLSDRSFVMFRNASHGEINVVYRREDGNIGWIDPAVPLRSMSNGRGSEGQKGA
jgi:ribosomal subunit interface protein